MMTTLLVVVGIALFISFLCSILEAVFLSITQSYVVVLSESRPKIGGLLAQLRKNIDQPIAAILTLNTISHTVGASIGGALALKVFGDHLIAAFSAILTLLILVFSEIFPKTLGAYYWQQLAPMTAIILKGLIIIMKPILLPLSWLNKIISPKKTKQVTVSRADLAILAEIGRREGTIDEEEWQVVRNVIHLDEIKVREVMTPRTAIVAIPVDSTIAIAKNTMLETGHFRLPVYKDSLDRIVGIVVARELLKAEQENQVDISSVVREAYCIPDSKLVEDLIREMRKMRIKMAIVIDEFGGTAGIVTLEDLIEQIVGDIHDEHENEPLQFKEVGDGSLKISGFVPIDDVNERLNTNLPKELYDTIGGFVFGELGRVPVVGDEVKCEVGKFKVATMDGLRVDRLIFTPDI
jgi:putative hemolysin